MKWYLLTFCLLIFSFKSNSEVYQCASGEFRDTPCPNELTKLPMGVEKRTTENQASTDASSNSTSGSYANEILEFGTTDEDKLRSAMVYLESMEIDARNCKVNIMVNDYDKSCLDMIKVFGENNKLQQVIHALMSLARNENLIQSNQYEFKKTKRIIEEIIDTKRLFDERMKK